MFINYYNVLNDVKTKRQTLLANKHRTLAITITGTQEVHCIKITKLQEFMLQAFFAHNLQDHYNRSAIDSPTKSCEVLQLPIIWTPSFAPGYITFVNMHISPILAYMNAF